MKRAPRKGTPISRHPARRRWTRLSLRSNNNGDRQSGRVDDFASGDRLESDGELRHHPKQE